MRLRGHWGAIDIARVSLMCPLDEIKPSNLLPSRAASTVVGLMIYNDF